MSQLVLFPHYSYVISLHLSIFQRCIETIAFIRHDIVVFITPAKQKYWNVLSDPSRTATLFIIKLFNYICYQRSGTWPPQGSQCNNRESRYLHISSYGQMFSSYVRKDLRYTLQFLNQPCNLDEDFLIESGKLSKPENSANQRSTRLMWVETINLGAIIHTTTRTYNTCKFQAESQNTDAG